MKINRRDEHLGSELLQAFLDGDVSPVEEARVREHTSDCARCRTELDAWQTLFSGLGGLEPLQPGPAFQARVLHALPLPRPLSRSQRVWQWLAGTVRGLVGLPPLAPRHLHPAPVRIQDFVEGLLSSSDALGVEGHLHACRDCRGEVQAWRGLFAGLGQLPSYAPSSEFQERVMAHVRVGLAVAAARPGLSERISAALATVSPRTRRRIAAFAGAGVTPAALLGLVVWAVFSHPLATFSNLWAFVRLWASDLLGGVAGGVVSSFTESGLLYRLYDAFDLLGRSPTTAALAATGMGALTLTAAWVLYRNVLAGPSGGRLYVR